MVNARRSRAIHQGGQSKEARRERGVTNGEHERARLGGGSPGEHVRTRSRRDHHWRDIRRDLLLHVSSHTQRATSLGRHPTPRTRVVGCRAGCLHGSDRSTRRSWPRTRHSAREVVQRLTPLVAGIARSGNEIGKPSPGGTGKPYLSD